MKVIGLSWTRFRLPLLAPFRSAAGEMTHREGFVLRLTTDAGIVGLGEASPHPAAGADAADEIERALESSAAQLVGAQIDSLGEHSSELPPALACAIDSAACDALARGRGVSVARLLSERVQAIVAVNATITASEASAAASEAAIVRRAGFACAKLKVGMGRDLDDERQRVAAVREALGPDVALRIDANGAWSADEAIAAIRALERYDLELVEQPVAAGAPAEMARVRAAVETPIAADEDVTGLESARQVLAADAADVLVVKPMVVGGPRQARRIAELALAAGAAVIVTTTIDAGVGTAAALHVAATLPAAGPACGLATGPLLADDIIAEPLALHRGRMAVAAAPGLGVELDEAKLARYSGPVRSVP